MVRARPVTAAPPDETGRQRWQPARRRHRQDTDRRAFVRAAVVARRTAGRSDAWLRANSPGRRRYGRVEWPGDRRRPRFGRRRTVDARTAVAVGAGRGWPGPFRVWSARRT